MRQDDGDRTTKDRGDGIYLRHQDGRSKFAPVSPVYIVDPVTRSGL